jgi:hypothetical protein
MAGTCLRKIRWWDLLWSLLVLGEPSTATADAALTAMLASGAPALILRGVALVEDGYARVYLEDPRTGVVTAYGPGDAVGDGRIERIEGDRVILRRADGLVHLIFGVPAAPPSEPDRAGVAPESRAAADASAAPARSAESVRDEGPVIGSGQPWLDRLGIPRGALARAVESAIPAAEPDD